MNAAFEHVADTEIATDVLIIEDETFIAIDLETLVDGCEIAEVKEMIHTHAELTGSLLAYRVLSNWDETLPHFVRVMPKDYKRMLQAFHEVETAGLSGDEAVMAAFKAGRALAGTTEFNYSQELV